jgi:hypothetical protein
MWYLHLENLKTDIQKTNVPIQPYLHHTVFFFGFGWEKVDYPKVQLKQKKCPLLELSKQSHQILFNHLPKTL